MRATDAPPSTLAQARSKARLLVDVPWDLVSMVPGWLQYLRTGTTSFRAYSKMRRLYYLTDGRFNDAVHEVLRRIKPPAVLDRTDGVLGDMKGPHLDGILGALQRDGYYVFEERLSDRSVNEMRAFALRTPCTPNGEGVAPTPVVFDESKRQAPTLHFNSNDLLACAPIRELLFDRSILALGQAQLRSGVVMDTPRMWWSCPGTGQPSSAAAQLYHVDLDRLRWLNFFFLLSDVDENNGPHCFVRTSHLHKPPELRKDGRHSDEEIARHYPNQVVELGGKRGTIFVVDTRGFHKGKMLTEGNRLMFQILLVDSLFGHTYDRLSIPPAALAEFRDMKRRFPFTYQSFDEAPPA